MAPMGGFIFSFYRKKFRERCEGKEEYIFKRTQVSPGWKLKALINLTDAIILYKDLSCPSGSLFVLI